MNLNQPDAKSRSTVAQRVATDAPDEKKKKEARERQQRRIALQLATFDSKPAAAGVDALVVAALCGCAVSTVWERSRRDADFPKPRKIGGRARWNVGELRELLQGEPA